MLKDLPEFCTEAVGLLAVYNVAIGADEQRLVYVVDELYDEVNEEKDEPAWFIAFHCTAKEM